MLQRLLIYFVLCAACASGVALASSAVSSTFYPRTVESANGAQVTLTPDQEPVALGDTRDWRLSWPDTQPYDLVSVQLNLPREGVRKTAEAELRNGFWVLPEVQFDQVGVWQLAVHFKTASGEDRVQFQLAIDNEPFVVAETPTLAQVALIRSLAMPLATQATLSDSERAAAELGHALFFDPAISGSGKNACASCHVPALAFSDQRARSHATSRNAPSVLGISHKQWFNRDGSKDSLWSQALGPIENADELDIDRVSLLQKLARDPDYAVRYAAVTGSPLPRELLDSLAPASPLRSDAERRNWDAMSDVERNTVNTHFAKLGKMFEAYQRQLVIGPSAFDRYAHALADGDPNADQHLTPDAQRGLMLFIGARTHCLDCHIGPDFSNQQFHNIGTASAHTPGADPGRRRGIDKLLEDPFNCASPYNTEGRSCDHLDGVWRTEVPYLLTGAFLTPGLRNVARTGPWFHDGSADSLMAVMQHYRAPPPSVSGRTEHELTTLALSDEELRQVVAFLESLSSDLRDPTWSRPPTDR